jgi:hypothetical protein
MKFTATARRLGIFSAAVTVILLVAYTVTLTVGLASLESPDQPIGDPMFTILEVLLLLMIPAMIALMVAVHAWAPTRVKTLTLTAVVFMGLLAGVTCVVHFCVLTLSRQPEFAGRPWDPLVFPFAWPSVVYAAPAIRGTRLATWVRVLMIASGVLSLAGLSGVVTGNMQLRNIGIVGYVGVFLFVAALLAILFYRTTPQEA